MDKLVQIPESRIQELADTVERLHEALAKAPSFSQLEKAVWKLQVGPLTPLVRQFTDLVEDVAIRLGRKVRVRGSGTAVEVGHEVLQALSVILLHAARNAVDHGIESPDERASKSKPAEGAIDLDYDLRRGRLRITVRDDGRGPDLARIARLAVERGLVTVDEAAGMNDERKLDLLFRAGFSTREEVTELSGRGVGLDVLRSAVEDLGGRARAAMVSAGTGFTVEAEVPLVQVGLEAACARIGNHVFWIPSDSFETYQSVPGAGELDSAMLMAKVLGWDYAPGGKPRVLKIVGSGVSKDWLIAVDEIGIPEFRLFRALDPMWRSAGPKWLQRWFDASGGHALACRVPGGERDGSFAVLGDVGALARLSGREA